MLPRQHQSHRSYGRAATYRSPRRAWVAALKHVHTCAFLLSFALLFVSVCAVEAENGANRDVESKSPALSHFNGLHTLSGASYRAFKNRLKRQMRGEPCLRYHVAGTWWHYEWCFDRHVRQFHPQPAGPKGQKPKELSILLGVYNAEKPQPLRVLAVDNLARLTDPDRMGYMAQQLYSSGDYCEERGARRSVKLQVKCCTFHDNETYVDSVEERAPCEYEMNVCSPVACGLMQRDQFVLTAPTYMEEEERKALTKTVRDMLYHAYNGYLKHAFPQDDLLPLSCRGGEFELGRLPMLTLVDTLDTLAVLEDATEFRRAVGLVVENADFDLDTEVSVFETTIRLLGGLLSAHLFAVNTDLKLYPEGGYDGALLRLAVDLGERLMPAFDTVTGIPYGTVNLKHGVPKGETPIASTAGAGSLSIEFTMLSVLTGDPKYAAASRGAVRALYQRRSKIGLLGKHINTKTGDWTETSSGPGSNSDSFYEYLLKMYELFGDRESLEMFAQVYPAVLAHNKHGDWYTDVSMYTGCHHHSGSSAVVFESLAAFWPGMQIAAGDLKPAAESMNAFYRVWRDYGFLSEQFNVGDWKPVKSRGGGGARYPLRPELIESTFYMHEATNDSSWLRAGAHVVHSLQKYAKTPCGYASIADVESKKQEDYMPSFFLSETCKYLYLLFNTTHFFRQGNYVMTTEAHPLPILPTKVVEPILQAADAYVTKSGVAYGNRYSPDNVMRCEAPKFYDLINYSIHYEGKVVARTSRCVTPAPSPAALLKASKSAPEKIAQSASERAKPTTSTTSTKATTKKKTKPIDTDSVASDVLQEWLPALEEKLRNIGGKNVNDDWLEQLLEESSLGRTKQRQPAKQQDAQGHVVQYLYGGSQLGEFRVEQLPGRLRVTREETGDWIEASDIVDVSHMIVGLGFDDGSDDDDAGADSYTFEEPTSKKVDHSDDYHPPHMAWNYVYKVNEDLSLPVDQRCSLRVQLGYTPQPGEPQHNEKGRPHVDAGGKGMPTVWLTVPCVGAGFGVTNTFKASRAFPTMQLDIADPVDACSEVSNLPEESLRGKIVLAQRGECYFEQKARNAEKWGAAGVIIANTEDDDLVMVMGGVDENSAETTDEPLEIPVVMVPQRLGEWFETRLAEAEASSLAPVKVSIELTVRHHAREVDDTRRRARGISGDKSFPRIDGTADNMKLYGPVWGMELVTMGSDREKDQEQEDVYHQDSFSIAIIGTPPWQH
ncbi:Alpha-mannosidase I [Phytophthora fragariae]|uniref:alpha-1,2-Mannosidase n=1 Tax=Phytophthora fragariae TaxID=53985 RepID=A0A6A3EY85_9STRA|nr:Alpha-mannosidase I [Phytophthora fragariae]KAE8934958.1 Alpha-mannosidase I [Phytophthora fragariae]KAE9007116.1 Alpha-mannosidase I [Phytophthora fragariae]KAE9103606.1 Alpha-mannosidase I [Phytophthora fragariae]KAE9104841.1 Alpha-mannosidase I [Phytophthora fragariae]